VDSLITTAQEDPCIKLILQDLLLVTADICGSLIYVSLQIPASDFLSKTALILRCHNRPAAEEMAILGHGETFFAESVLTRCGPYGKAEAPAVFHAAGAKRELPASGQFEGDRKI
jgi:hypothetical protein